MDLILMDKLRLMVKLKEKIYAMKNSGVNKAEVARMEKLLRTIENTAGVKHI